MSQSFRKAVKAVKGFTLVELAVVIVIIGVLAAFGVPRFIMSVERSKAAEAFAYLASVRAAEERFHARQGTYTTDITELDIRASAPKYFEVPGSNVTTGLGGTVTAGAGSAGIETSWTLTLVRKTPAAGYGAYTVTFTEDGYDATHSDIPDVINPMAGNSSGS